MNHAEAMVEIRSGSVRPVYLLYGGEPFLEDEVYRAIRAAVVQPETADFNLHVFEPGPDQLQRALITAQTHPFFAERRLVVVRDCPVFAASRKGADEGEAEEEKQSGADEALVAYLKTPARSTCLVFRAGETVDSRRKVTKAAIGTGGAVDCAPLKEQDAAMWAQARCQSYGKRLGDPAARLLLEKTGADLRLIDSELLKLTIYVGAARDVVPADVDAAVGGVAEAKFYHLTEAVMLKQRGRALTLLERLLLEVDHPLQLLAALTGHFRQMLVVKALTARGVSLREGPVMARMKPYPYEKMVTGLKHYPRDRIAKALSQLLEADLAMKSGFDARLTLETVVVELLT